MNRQRRLQRIAMAQRVTEVNRLCAEYNASSCSIAKVQRGR